MDEAITKENNLTQNNPNKAIETPLFGSYAVTFLEDALKLIENLGLILDEANSIINDKEKLNNVAYDYRFLFELDSKIREIKKGDLTIGALQEWLQEKLEGLKKTDPELAKLVSELVFIGTFRSRILETISKGLSEPEKLSGRIELLIEYAKRELEEGSLKRKVMYELTLIQKYLGEINSLVYCLHDVNEWNMHVHDDVLFFTQRIEGYFKGGLFKDARGEDIKGLDEFKDEALRKAIFGSIEVRKLYYVASFTHRVDEQIGFISRLIALLQRDIKGNQWVSIEATQEFYKHIDEFANTFRTEFADNPFANYLQENKANVGEQPFRWIAILNGWRERLEELMRRKNTVIEDAKNYLINLFEKRIGLLRNAISLHIKQIASESSEMDLLKKIEDAFKKFKRELDKLWENRRKRFKYTYDKIEDIRTYVVTIIEQLVEVIDPQLEAEEMAQQGKSIAQFSAHKEELLRRLEALANRSGLTNPQITSYLLLLDFDFARLAEFHEVFDKALQDIREKDSKLKSYDLSQIKLKIRELISAGLRVVSWLRARIKLEGIEYIEQSSIKFMRENYGTFA